MGVFPLIPCMKCPQCLNKEYEMCNHYNYLGSRTNGGFAEYVRVPEWNLLALPDAVSMEQAAMLEPMAVAVHAIKRAQTTYKDKIAVCGMGTIGLFVVMYLLDMGCENIYVAGNKDFQRSMAERMGLKKECYCDVRQTAFSDWIMDKTDNTGVDVFFDCVGKNEVLEQGIGSLAAKGIMLLVGNPSTDMGLKKELYWKILRRQLRLVGTWNSSFTHDDADDWNYVLGRLECGGIHPEKMITHRMTMESFLEGFEIMQHKKEDYIKIMMLR